MDDLVYLLYTHTDYKDILDIHINQFIKYCKDIKLIIAINNKEYIKKDDYIFNIIEYDDTKPYMERLSYILSNIDEDYILLNHDINVPIDTPKNNIFSETISFMSNNNIDQVRMFVSGISSSIFDDNIYHQIPEGSYYFSINSAIWKKSSLFLLAYLFKNHDYRCAECTSIQNYVKELNNYYISSKNDIILEGHNHVISYNFPCCHVTTNGKWTINPYNKQTLYIYNLINKYDIDINIRGTN